MKGLDATAFDQSESQSDRFLIGELPPICLLIVMVLQMIGVIGDSLDHDGGGRSVPAEECRVEDAGAFHLGA
jgi:hypothetical protein